MPSFLRTYTSLYKFNTRERERERGDDIQDLSGQRKRSGGGGG